MDVLKKNTISIDELIQIIDDAQPVNNDHLIARLKEVAFTQEMFSGYFTHDHDPMLSYGRKVIHQGKNYILFLMSWAPGDFTAIHSHGYSDWGAVVFLSPMNHRLYEVTGNTIRLKDKSIVPQVTVAPVKGSLVHAMGNLSDIPAVTMHLYGSNQQLSNANDDSLVYEIEKKQVRTTGGAAYLNISEDLCKKTEPGLITDSATLLDYLDILRPYYNRIEELNMVELIDAWVRDPGLY